MVKPLRSTVTVDFNSYGASGPATISSGVARVYKNGSTTPTTTGVTLSIDVDSKTGSNRVAINTATDTSFFDGEMDCSVRVEGTVDGEAHAATVGEFQLRGIAGIIVDDASNSASTFEVDIPSLVDDQFNRAYLRFTGGALAGQVSKISDCVGSTGFITVQDAFTAEPTAGDPFEIINS